MSKLASFSPAALLLAGCAGIGRADANDLIDSSLPPPQRSNPDHIVSQHRLHDRDAVYLDLFGSLEAGGSTVFEPYDTVLAGFGSLRLSADAGGPLGEWGKLELNSRSSLRYGPGAPDGVSGNLVTALALSEACEKRSLGVVGVNHLEGSSENHSTVNDWTAGVRFQGTIAEAYGDEVRDTTKFSIDATTNGDISWYDLNLYSIPSASSAPELGGSLNLSYRCGEGNKLFRLEVGMTFPMEQMGHFVPALSWGFENDQIGDDSSHSDHRMYLSLGLGTGYSVE